MAKNRVADKAVICSVVLVIAALLMLTITFMVLYFKNQSAQPAEEIHDTTASEGPSSTVTLTNATTLIQADTTVFTSPPTIGTQSTLTDETSTITVNPINATSTTEIPSVSNATTTGVSNTSITTTVPVNTTITANATSGTTATATVSTTSAAANSTAECVSPGCLKVADALRKSINRSVDPCDNFYDFACGKWSESHPMPLSENKWDAFALLGVDLTTALHELLEPDTSPFTQDQEALSALNATEKAQFYYGACADKDALENPKVFDYYLQFLESIFPQIRNFPFRTEVSIPSMDEIGSALINARKYRSSLNIITAGVGPDNDNSKKAIVMFIPAKYGPDAQVYLERSDPAQASAYELWMTDMMLTFTRKANMSLSTEEAEALASMFRFYEAVTSQAQLTPAQLKSKQLTTNKMTLDRFATTFSTHVGLPTDKLVAYFREAWQIPVDDAVLNGSTIVNVVEPGYYAAVVEFFGDAPNDTVVRRELANYISFQLALSFANRLGVEFANITQRYMETVAGITEATERWKTCVSRTQTELSEPVGRLYVMEHFDKDTKRQLVKKVDYLFDSFQTIVLNSEWMTPATRINALKKAELFKVNIGYDDYIVDTPERLDEAYQNFNITSHSYLANSINYRRFVALSEGQFFLSELGSSSWVFGPATINAWHLPNFASITFPAAILQPPFFSADYPDWWNFGAIGTIIGHEITHGFDNTGSLYDGYGNMVNWWDTESRTNFTQRAIDLRDQYDAYQMQGVRINGTLTLGENIADSGALKEALQAYRLFNAKERGGQVELPLPGFEYHAEQLFFIANAQAWCSTYTDRGIFLDALSNTHAPGRFRVTGPMQNYDEFSKAFNCSRDSYMNPSIKNGIW